MLFETKGARGTEDTLSRVTDVSLGWDILWRPGFHQIDVGTAANEEDYDTRSDLKFGFVTGDGARWQGVGAQAKLLLIAVHLNTREVAGADTTTRPPS